MDIPDSVVIKLTRARILLLAQPKSMRSIIEPLSESSGTG